MPSWYLHIFICSGCSPGDSDCNGCCCKSLQGMSPGPLVVCFAKKLLQPSRRRRQMSVRTGTRSTLCMLLALVPFLAIEAPVWSATRTTRRSCSAANGCSSEGPVLTYRSRLLQVHACTARAQRHHVAYQRECLCLLPQPAPYERCAKQSMRDTMDVSIDRAV